MSGREWSAWQGFGWALLHPGQGFRRLRCILGRHVFGHPILLSYAEPDRWESGVIVAGDSIEVRGTTCMTCKARRKSLGAVT